MTKQIYVEYGCDFCRSGCHYIPPETDIVAMADGWIIVRGYKDRETKHYCSESCRKKGDDA